MIEIKMFCETKPIKYNAVIYDEKKSRYANEIKLMKYNIPIFEKYLISFISHIMF